MEKKHEDDPEPIGTTIPDDDRAPEPVDPDDAEEPGFGGDGGPAAVIFGEDDEADEHGDRLSRGPDESL